jgi:hypothetical protein
MSISTRLLGLEARLRALADLNEIETLKARYWRAIDLRHPDDVAACLTKDATIDFEGLPRFTSRAAFMEIVRQGAAQTRNFGMHHGHHPSITFTGENAAAGEWDIFYCGIDLSTRTLVQMAGIYTDLYVRLDQRWLIASTTMRQISLLAQTVTPAGTVAVLK